MLSKGLSYASRMLQNATRTASTIVAPRLSPVLPVGPAASVAAHPGWPTGLPRSVAAPAAVNSGKTNHGISYMISQLVIPCQPSKEAGRVRIFSVASLGCSLAGTVVVVDRLLHRSKRSFTTTARAAGDYLSGAQQTPKVFASLDLYLKDGGLSITPIGPQWQPTNKGTGYIVKREGVFCCDFAPAVPGQPGKTNWAEKIIISLSCLEMATVIAVPEEEHTFYHDTHKGTSNAGTLIKTLKWSPAADGKHYNVSVKMQDNSTGEERAVTVTLGQGELHLIKNLSNHSFAYLTGWHDRLIAEQQ